jgi:hypothetical protein
MGIGWSIHRNDGWRGQLERVQRWHSRTVTAAQTGSPDLQDFIFVFFQNCYHLREWLCQTSTISKHDVDGFFNGTKELLLCRDICNATKHLNINRASVDATFSIGYEYNPSEPSNARLFLIADAKYDLLDLASRCLKLLEQFTAQDTIEVANGPRALKASQLRKST